MVFEGGIVFDGVEPVSNFVLVSILFRERDSIVSFQTSVLVGVLHQSLTEMRKACR